MATEFPGALYLYEGTTLQCDTNQQKRELFFDTQSGLLRYKREDSEVVYIECPNASGTPGYYSKFISENVLGNGSISEDGTDVYVDKSELNVRHSGTAYVYVLDTGSTKASCLEQCGSAYIETAISKDSTTSLGITTGNLAQVRAVNSSGFVIGTGTNAPVYLTSNNTPRAVLKGDGTIGLGTITPSGPVGALDIVNATTLFGVDASRGRVWINGSEIGSYYNADTDTADLSVNYNGYQGSNTRFRDFEVYDGKRARLIFVDGSTKAIGMNAGLHVGGESAAGDNNLIVDGTTTLTGPIISQLTLSGTGAEGIVINRAGGGGGYINFQNGSGIYDWVLQNNSSASGNLRLYTNPTYGGKFFKISKDYNSNPSAFTVDPDNSRVGVNTSTPTTTLDVGGIINSNNEIISPSGKMTLQGGFATYLTNNTGTTTVKGQIVHCSGTLGFSTANANDDMPIGIVLDAGVANGSKAWIVCGGVADVLIDAGGCNIGDWVGTGATAGSANGDATVPLPGQHFQEIGHALETRANAGLAKCILHFN